jgi:hypothetical protein
MFYFDVPAVRMLRALRNWINGLVERYWLMCAEAEMRRGLATGENTSENARRCHMRAATIRADRNRR